MHVKADLFTITQLKIVFSQSKLQPQHTLDYPNTGRFCHRDTLLERKGIRRDVLRTRRLQHRNYPALDHHRGEQGTRLAQGPFGPKKTMATGNCCSHSLRAE